MKLFCPEDVRTTPEEYRALRRAASRQNGRIIDPPDPLRKSPLWCMEGLIPDGYGGLMHGKDTRLVITDEGRRYVKWHKRQTARKVWEKAKGYLAFLIPLALDIIWKVLQ